MAHYVYILASIRSTIYTSSTNNLRRRLEQHVSGAVNSFVRKYRTNRLVYAEVADSAEAAFARERQIKGLRREKKVALIEAGNPHWEDLSSKLLA